MDMCDIFKNCDTQMYRTVFSTSDFWTTIYVEIYVESNELCTFLQVVYTQREISSRKLEITREHFMERWAG